MPPCDIDTRDIDTRFYDKNIFILFGAIVSAVICCLYGGFATHAGALWRDEVNSLEMATMPTLSDVWSAMNYDSFPILLTLVLRLWIAITGVATEASLRAFGFLVAIAVLAALWCSSRLLGSRAPWLSLVLFAGSPLVIRTIECIRPYGLGVAFILTTLGLVWMVATRRGGWPMFVVASMAATLSVQCLYSNAVLLLAICLGGLVVALDRRDWRCGPLVLGVGLISAISLLPYQGHLRTAATWLAPVRRPISIPLVFRLCAGAMKLSFQPFRHVWLLLLLASLAVACKLLIGGRRREVSDERRWLVLFSITSLVASAILTLAFLRSVGLPPSPWHYVPWMALAAVLLEAVFDQAIVSVPWGWVCRLAAAGLLTFVIMPTWRDLSVRQTNVDLVAEELQQYEREGDRIFVHPWTIGVSFRHYYRGQTPWVTFPPVSDLRIHRYDLYSDKVTWQPLVRPIMDDMAATLSSGGRIFLVSLKQYSHNDFTELINDPTRFTQQVLIVPPPSDVVNQNEALGLTVVASRRMTPKQLPPTVGPERAPGG